ncbi:MAG TPA: helix-turn-helix transcriptional regulator [Bacteroidales bacterium]|jgi:predicted RNase H-like HicB family nuclease|nr:helix-turn-helix transcriptional regulator [Bacteroidales bacterium]
MMKISVTIDYCDKNFSAGTGAMGGVVIATGKSLESVKREFEEAFAFHIEGCTFDDDLPEWVIKGKYEFDYELSVSALLQYFDGILTRSALARVTGINERQLGHYATGHRRPRAKQREKIIKGFHKLGEEFIAVV